MFSSITSGQAIRNLFFREHHVRIKLKDGTVVEENQPYPRGGLELPLPPEDIEAKFRANAGMVLSKEKVEKVVTMVRGLEELPSVTPLADLLTPS